MIEPADFGLLQFSPAPFDRVGFGHGLNNLDHLCAGLHAFFTKLEEPGVRGCASVVRVLENTVLAGGDASCTNVAIPAAAGFFCGSRSGFRRWRLAQAAEHLSDHISNQDFIDRAHDINSASSFLEDLFAQNIDGIDDANNYSVH